MVSRWRLGETRPGHPWGGQAGSERALKSPLGRASNTFLDAKVVLERLWNVYEGAFERIFDKTRISASGKCMFYTDRRIFVRKS